MNREIPKPLRNALTRPWVGDVHPSPDVLTSFMERTLVPMENEVVIHHLALCAECREVVFLASEAAEDEVLDETQLVAAAAGREAPVPAYAAAALRPFAAALRPAAAPAQDAPSRWTIRTRWALSFAAVVVLASAGIVVQVWRSRSEPNAATSTVGGNRPVPANPEAMQSATASTSQESFGKPSTPETMAKATSHGVIAARTGNATPSTVVTRNEAESRSAAAVQPAPAATGSQPTSDAFGEVGSALVPKISTQNSFAENGSAQPLQLQQSAPVVFGKARMGVSAMAGSRPQWRIGPEGHLERSSAADQWTRVLDDQPTTFRAVAAVGNDVWAGGNGGALFHSSDRGEHWNKVPLAANSNVETGAIVSIHFVDPQHGMVASDSGTRWATTDGGVTWLIQ